LDIVRHFDLVVPRQTGSMQWKLWLYIVTVSYVHLNCNVRRSYDLAQLTDRSLAR